jgi:peptide/nickel transport system permease protein
VRARRSGHPAIWSAKAVHRSALHSGARRPAGLDLSGAFRHWRHSVLERVHSLRAVIAQVARRPAALAGLTGIAMLAALAIYAMLSIPYRQAVALWQGEQGSSYALPENALPEWVDWFNRDSMAHTVRADSRSGQAIREEISVSRTTRQLVLTFPLEFDYDRFPQDVAVFFYPEAGKEPYVSMVWRQPDGQEILLGNQAVRTGEAYRASLDARLARRLRADRPERVLFGMMQRPVAGSYTLVLTATLFDPSDSLEAEVVVYGEVYGAAGTDGRRRDVMVAVLWGTPVALAFGLLAALGSTLAAALIAAASAWYGGTLDGLVQRISEVNMVLPSMAVSLMIFTMYSKSFWVVLSVTVALSIFGSGMRTYRAMLQQAVASPWVEAARAQGAGGARIIWRYLIPYLAPVLVPQMVSLVPSYVFLESALAYLGMSDPSLPTWGRLVQEAFAGDVYGGNYHLVLVPALLLLFMALSFGLLGRSLEQVLNPRLRDR